MRRRLGTFGLSVLLVAGLGVAPVRADDNQPPVAVDDPAVPGCQQAGLFGGAFPIPEDFSYPADADWFAWFGACLPTANDTDPDGDPLMLELVGQPAHGEATWFQMGANALLRYRAEPDWSTLPGDVDGGDWFSDSIPYRVSDGTASSNTASYRIWIMPINDAPTFTPGPALVEGEVNGPAVSVPWATAIDPGPYESGQSVSFEVVTDDRNAPGAFAVPPAIDGSGTLTFTPGNEPTLATVTVTAKDDGGMEDWDARTSTSEPPDDTSDAVTFEIVIWGPGAVDDEATVPEDTAWQVDVLANDNDGGNPVTVVDASDGTKGTVEVVGDAVIYWPAQDATGTDSFTYTIEDSAGRRSHATVTVAISPVNDDPVAADDEFTVDENAAATVVDVLGNDEDVDGDELAIDDVGPAGHGLVIVSGGVLSYQPAPEYAGPDSFTYTVTDGHGGTDTASVAVTVASDVLPPVVVTGPIEIAGKRLGSDVVRVRVRWSATDPGAGVAAQAVEQRRPSGSWRLIGQAVPPASSLVVDTSPGDAMALRVRATDARGNIGPWATWPEVVTRVRQEASPSIDWTGRWKAGSDAGDAGGGTRWTGGSGRRATLEVKARAIAWVGRRQPDGGRAEVWVDGVLLTTVDTAAPTMTQRAVLARVAWPERGPHRVEIRTLGGGRVDVDAFVVVR